MASITAVRSLGLLRKTLISSRPAGLRLISTSKKNRETASITDVLDRTESKSESAVVKKNWVSYGFDYKSETEDRNAMNAIFFVTVSMCLVGGTFIWSYFPDYQSRDWAQREAFLEIRRREELGLPHVDPNLIDISKIELPSDEELGDTEIII